VADWIKFADRLPTRDDADESCEVMARHHPLMPWRKNSEHNSRLDRSRVIERPCLWNWIPPSAQDAREVWMVNGFIEWRPLSPSQKEGTQ
jgi:hypothetical protein